MCHISELPEPGNFRTTSIAGVNVIAINNGDGVKVYRNPGKFMAPAGSMTRVQFYMDEYEELFSEVKHGQMVWVTLNDSPMPLDAWLGGAFDCIRCYRYRRTRSISLS